MDRRFVKVVGVILAAVLLLTMSGLASCGGTDESEGHEIRIGILTDFTGPAAFAARQATNAIIDYFRLLEETDPIPGVKVKIITYDTRSDFSRVVPGYLWLKGQGAVLVYPISGDDLTMLEPRLARDEISGINEVLSIGV